MNKAVVMGAALACAPGVFPEARARDVPVYREYTRDIAFYDEEGRLAGFGSDAPDLLARRALRDAKAQEGLMGKETLLDVSFGPGVSFFDSGKPVSGKLTPPASGGEGRGRKDDSSRNWLVKSLTLPSLGQAPTNAAASAIPADASPSGWGWLADELSGMPAGAARGTSIEPIPSVDEMAMGLPTDLPVGLDGKPTDGDDESATADKSPSGTAAEERMAAGGWNAPGGDSQGASARTAPAIAEMGQTRRIIDEIASAAKPDFSAWREALETGAPVPEDAPKEPTVGSLAPSSTGGAASWSSAGTVPSAFGGNGLGISKPLSTPSVAPGSRSWQGGWKAQEAVSAGSSSRFGTSTEPVAVPVAPPLVRDVPSRTPSSSGAYKPGWY